MSKLNEKYEFIGVDGHIYDIRTLIGWVMYKKTFFDLDQNGHKWVDEQLRELREMEAETKLRRFIGR